METVARGAATDPRVERTRSHVLAHARQLLSDGGTAEVTYSKLAARAKVTRQTLYRHWPTRELLLVDLVMEPTQPQMPDSSGPPADIVRSFLRRLRDAMDEPGNAAPLTALIAHADHDPTSRHALRDIVTTVRTSLDESLKLGGSRIDADQYARLVGPVLFQRFFARMPTSDAFIDELVAHWPSTCRPPGEPRDHRPP